MWGDTGPMKFFPNLVLPCPPNLGRLDRRLPIFLLTCKGRQVGRQADRGGVK